MTAEVGGELLALADVTGDLPAVRFVSSEFSLFDSSVKGIQVYLIVSSSVLCPSGPFYLLPFVKRNAFLLFQ